MKVINIIKGYPGGLDNISREIFINSKLRDIDEKILYFYDYGNKFYKDFDRKKLFHIDYKNEVIFVNLFNHIKELSKADIIHVHHVKTWLLFTPLLFFKKKIIHTFHGNFGSGIRKNLLQGLIIRLIMNYTTIFSKRMIFLTKGQENHLESYTFFKKMFHRKSIVINNFIDNEIILKSKQKFNSDIVFVGRYTKIKGFKDLLKVADSLKDINFNLIGDNNFKSNLKNVKNIGVVNNKNILKPYDQDSIFILPSYTEAFPITILEAMARGLVILISDIPGMREIVKEGRNGYLFPPGDIEKMKELILYLKNNPKEIERISKNNLKDIWKFTAEKQIPKYIKVYEEVLKENGK